VTNICSVRFGPVDVAIYSVPLEFADIDAKRAWIRRQHFQECGLEAGGKSSYDLNLFERVQLKDKAASQVDHIYNEPLFDDFADAVLGQAFD
jgi:hypothetical protein